MNSIIVVLPKPEDGKSIRNLLSRHGYDVTAVCTQGSQVLNYIDMMESSSADTDSRICIILI